MQNDYGPWKKRCWMLAIPRSGSTWLAQVLAKSVGLEPVKGFFGEDRHQFLEHFHPSYKYKTSIEFYEHDPIVTKFMTPLWPLLEVKHRPSPTDTAAIVLLRRDIRAQAISYLVSEFMGKFHDETLSEVDNRRAVLDRLRRMPSFGSRVDDCIRLMRDWYVGQTEVARHFPNRVTIVYEDLLDPNKRLTEFDRIFSLLELKWVQLDLDVSILRSNS